MRGVRRVNFDVSEVLKKFVVSARWFVPSRFDTSLKRWSARSARVYRLLRPAKSCRGLSVAEYHFLASRPHTRETAVPSVRRRRGDRGRT